MATRMFFRHAGAGEDILRPYCEVKPAPQEHFDDCLGCDECDPPLIDLTKIQDGTWS